MLESTFKLATVFIVDAFISKDCLKDVVARESATLSRF